MEVPNFVTCLEEVLTERNSEGENFFHEAARCGSFSIIARFTPFIRGNCVAAALNTTNIAGQMSIHVAAVTHEKWYAAKLIDILVELGADINGQESVEGNTALHLAVNRRDYQLVEWLCCQPGIDLKLCNAKNLSPFELAQINRNKMMQILRKYYSNENTDLV
ncbi:GSCOCT00014325001.2-RA-CDS [Cotesia congregata]|uniref:Cc_vank.4_14.5 n=2 Tax=root TaxID=1 RepID=S6D322_COTCN|nr:Cactus-like4 [Bracoviriform congregatae]CAD6244536.1 GSCOCT00014325001.2-RA-CDS [Cotesia congregata]CAE47495.1 putative ankyrin protein 4 [Bracoviriform congregatae]CAG17448.1 Cactus-like4 [Bracoviriform congregatae]CAG5075275.1 cc_vank.4_14.5 [Cotesia congregata]CCQ71346.1 viral ankyrin VANK-4 [Cotesia congregata]